jgi:3-phenylpropionate/trans-cinnamate dioxygenase ferredoxin reductase component
VTGARLADGSEIALDFVVVGIGIAPDTGAGRGGGDRLDNGILVDDLRPHLRPHVWAAGDCARLPYPRRAPPARIVQNAIDQAEAVARNMLGADEALHPAAVVLVGPVRRASPDRRAQSRLGRHRRPAGGGGERQPLVLCRRPLLAVDAMNDARAYMVGKRFSRRAVSPGKTEIADPATDLKALLKP